MAKPTTRQELIDYCLRKLGQPVINVNVAQEQLDDRLDQALETYYEKHYDATEELWMFYPLTQADVDAGYFELPDNILSVTEIVYPGGSSISQPSGMFSYQYQFMANQLSPWQPFDSIDYFMKLTNIQMVSNMIDPERRFEFIRHENKIRVYDTTAGEGCPIAMRVYKMLDESYVYNDKWLKEYLTALIKKQWAENTSKFENIQLLGGVTINGERLMLQAMEELEKLEETLEDTYMEPPMFIFG